MSIECPQIDQLALVVGERLADHQQARHHEAISQGQICGWRSLAAAVVCQGVKRAQQEEHCADEPLSLDDTVENARAFVLGEWSRYLLCDLCDMDPLTVRAAQEQWAAQWEQERQQRERETAQHEALPPSLMPDWYIKGQQHTKRAEEVWG